MSYINQITLDGTTYSIEEDISQISVTADINIYIDVSLTAASGNDGSTASAAIYKNELASVLVSRLNARNSSVLLKNTTLNILLLGTATAFSLDLTIYKSLLKSVNVFCGYEELTCTTLTITGTTKVDIQSYTYCTKIYVNDASQCTSTNPESLSNIYVNADMFYWLKTSTTDVSETAIYVRGGATATLFPHNFCTVYFSISKSITDYTYNLTCTDCNALVNAVRDFTLSSLTADTSIVNIVNDGITVDSVTLTDGGTVIQNNAFLT